MELTHEKAYDENSLYYFFRATQNFNPSPFLLQPYFTRTNEASWGNLQVSASKLSEMTVCQTYKSLQTVFD